MRPHYSNSTIQFCAAFTVALCALTLTTKLHAQIPAAPDTRPNILLLLSEDQGLQLGCYGDTVARTPRLDRLADTGVRFDNAYVVQAGCSPSRAALLTGLYPHQNGQIGLATHRMRMYHGDIPNLPTLLHGHGYRTALIGKLHINPEENFVYDSRVTVGNFNIRDVAKVARAAADVFNESGRPFFLQISYNDTHSPYVPKKSDGGLPVERQDPDGLTTLPFLGASTPQTRETLAHYYDCVSRLDTGVGMVLDALDKAGKSDNTLVIFMSDHGPQLIRGKMSCYEGGLRIPLIIRYPGKMRAGAVRTELITELDLAPTVLEAAGLSAPDHWPGRSVLPLLTDDVNDWRDMIFTEFTLHWPVTYYPQRAVRDSRYKLIHNLLPGRDNPVCEIYLKEKDIPTIQRKDLPTLSPEARQAIHRFGHPPAYELYDLQVDPWEFHNLADLPEHAEALARLKQALEQWQVETDDPLRHPEVLERFNAEVAATFTGPGGTYEHVGQMPSFTWQYPDYFMASMREQTRRNLGIAE